MNKNNLSSFSLSPKVNQYNSHMVMSEVIKPIKKKYLNIDTKYCDEYYHKSAEIINNVANYNITLPERIYDVKSVRIINAEIPMTYFNISKALGNSYFKVTFPIIDTEIVKIFFIPDGRYTITDVINTLNDICSPYKADLQNYGLTFGYNPTNRNQLFINFYPAESIIIDFSINPDGVFDKYNFKNKLGWLLGFREPTIRINGIFVDNSDYSIPNQVSHYANNFYNLSGMKYLYLALDEFSKGNQSSFIAPISNAVISKNIITKIILDNQKYPFGTILPVNIENGSLMENKRTYNGKIDLQKFNIQLLDENGNLLALNDADFSFGLEIEYE